MLSKLFVLIAFSVGSAHCLSGASITFSGVIDQSSIGGIPVGTPFSGTVLYDPSGPLLGAGSNYANYSVGGAGYGIALNVGAFSFTGSGYLNMMVSDGPNNARLIPNADIMDISADTFSTFSTTYPGLVYGILIEFVGDLDLLTGNVPPNPFPAGDVFLNGATAPSGVYISIGTPGQPSSEGSMRGVLDSAIAIPEPATSVLLVIGLVCGAVAFRLRGAGVSPRRSLV